MKHRIRGSVLSLGAVIVATLAAPMANAGCGDALLKQESSWLPRPNSGAASLQLASLTTAPSIVGMWDVKFVSGGKQIDFGYSVWHSDGTEFLNSGGRAPSTQNYCLGVWKKTGALTYKLNHLALSYDTSGTLNARVHIRELVTLSSSGNSYSGPFTINAFDLKGKLLQHVTGTITGKRITVD